MNQLTFDFSFGLVPNGKSIRMAVVLLGGGRDTCKNRTFESETIELTKFRFQKVPQALTLILIFF